MNNMKTILNEWRKRTQLNEAGLSRLHQHTQEHDCAILTAFRNDAADMSQCAQGAEEPSEGENNKTRNGKLKAILRGLKIGVTKVYGTYIEDFETPQAIEVKEDRDEYFRSLTDTKTKAIENDLHKEEHPAMPIHQERQSRVTFGGKKS